MMKTKQTTPLLALSPGRRATAIRRLAGNTIFTVTFRKRTTGRWRKMVCRLGVAIGVKGADGRGPAYNPKDYWLLPVYDVQKNAWRSIPMDQIVCITIRGRKYTQGEN
jgi:hypothetical protein